jgi:hypothetical protein
MRHCVDTSLRRKARRSCGCWLLERCSAGSVRSGWLRHAQADVSEGDRPKGVVEGGQDDSGGRAGYRRNPEVDQLTEPGSTGAGVSSQPEVSAQEEVLKFSV